MIIGAAFTILVVHTAAAEHGRSARIRAKSRFVLLRRMPQCMPEAVKPGAAVTPPGIKLIGCIRSFLIDYIVLYKTVIFCTAKLRFWPVNIWAKKVWQKYQKWALHVSCRNLEATFM